MKKYFTITTNRETAEQIRKQCEFDEKYDHRSYRLGDIQHHEGYTIVKIEAKRDLITPSDIFWLGHFSASWKIDN
jgi:type IV secretory pathway TraG/TraD family ATPase VirD4